MKKNAITAAATLIRQANKTIALTGAGVSTESGIPDFRSHNGLWSRYDPMEYGTISAFRRNPHKVWTMLAELCKIIDARPNPGHAALAALEKAGYLDGIITQNIDLLHHKAGSRTVVEFHGSMATVSCLDCGKKDTLESIKHHSLPPLCPNCGNIMKPDIIFFDEQIPPNTLAWTDELMADADLLLVAGTSCQVMPAALIPSRMKRQGGKIIELNREPALGHLADLVLAGSFAAIMTPLADELGCTVPRQNSTNCSR